MVLQVARLLPPAPNLENWRDPAFSFEELYPPKKNIETKNLKHGDWKTIFFGWLIV